MIPVHMPAITLLTTMATTKPLVIRKLSRVILLPSQILMIRVPAWLLWPITVWPSCILEQLLPVLSIIMGLSLISVFRQAMIHFLPQALTVAGRLLASWGEVLRTEMLLILSYTVTAFFRLSAIRPD